ncbi:MAG: glycoside hydrolase family 31 protein [Anaerolineaceae bacterium]|nr:glycoside hydrolase family 31 protein [Anaerolineaceae bacterium]
MRIIQPGPLTLQETSLQGLKFKGYHQETLQITVLEEDIIRVQHFPDGKPRLMRTWSIVDKYGDVPLEGRSRENLSAFKLPAFNISKSTDKVQFSTSKMRVEINITDGRLVWCTQPDHIIFASDLQRRAYSYDQNGETIFHYVERRSDEHYYGFGERSGPLDKYGRRMRMLNLDALGYDAEIGDPLYKHIPFYITYIPGLNLAYGLFYDNLSTSIFDMGQERDNYYGHYRYYQAEAGDLDYYLIFGPQISDVVQKFSKLIGHPALPPRWSLGYLGSSMLYTDAENAQDALNEFITDCEKHQIPCDMFHLSSGYGSGADGKRYVFNWNFEKIPDPKKMVADFHQAGIHLMANIKPCLLESHPLFDEVAKFDGFIKDSESGNPRLDYFWDGYGSHLDFTNPTTFNWWSSNVQKWLLDYGIDATWNDNNEYPIWDDDAICFGFGEEIKIKHIRPLQPYLMVRSSLQAQFAHAPEKRPFLLARSASPGTQRHAQTWSGDNETSWKTLRYNIPMGLGLSLSGFPNTGHDVGGFTGPGPSEELLVRWVQNGIFHPRFTIHSWNTDGTANTPWMHAEVLPIIRETIKFRYRLIPYLYTQFFEAFRNGHPIIRPMVYQFPDDENCHQESFDFMLGPNLLVASVLEPEQRMRQVYLPKGQNWVDIHTGTNYEGGQTVQLEAPLEHIPLLVIAGSVLPQMRDMRFMGEKPDDVRLLYLYPDSGENERTTLLVEDDGISLKYKDGDYTEIYLTLNSTHEKTHLDIQYGHKGYQTPYNHFEVILPHGEFRPLTISCPEGMSATIRS